CGCLGDARPGSRASGEKQGLITSIDHALFFICISVLLAADASLCADRCSVCNRSRSCCKAFSKRSVSNGEVGGFSGLCSTTAVGASGKSISGATSFAVTVGAHRGG